MAIQLPKFNFFSKLDAKSRVFFLVGVVVGIAILIYAVVHYFTGGSATTGPSSVAAPPTNLQSVPGSQLSPEYYRALVQANAQASQQAQISGGSAVPTLINVPGQASDIPSTNCNVVCPSDENANVADDLNNLVRQGKLSQADANALAGLANNNVPVGQYAAALDDLVKQGKLTPEQARMLLDHYMKQHRNALVNDSAKAMDPLIKSGQLPLDAANDLLALQKKGPTPDQYAAELNRLVNAGKISPETGAQLLAQAFQQCTGELAKERQAQLQQMVKNGQLTPDTATTISDLLKRNLPSDQYQSQLQQLVSAGKLTPDTATKLNMMYAKQCTTLGALKEALAAQAQACAAELNGYVQQGKLTSADVANLNALRDKQTPVSQYQAYLSQLISPQKISPDEAKAILMCYQKWLALQNEIQTLGKLQGDNASIADYTNELKRAVQAGILTPDQAANLLREYAAMSTPSAPGALPTVQANIPGAEDFAALQARISQGQPATPVATVSTTQFDQAAAAAADAADQARLQRIQALQAAMSNQAQSLLAAWQPPIMQQVVGSAVTDATKVTSVTTTGTAVANAAAGAITKTTGAPIIKAGTILFAILDTAVDSDYPDTPVMATIVQGPFKGAKLLGRLALAKNQDRVSLTFNLMNMDQWPDTKAINAFAIDPDTARTVMATSVNYHYLLRYGSIFATSFLSGYASAVQNSGATTTTSIFGNTTGNATYSPLGKIAIGLGQVGTALTNVVSSYANTPTTVRVRAGVGVGILFMADVTE